MIEGDRREQVSDLQDTEVARGRLHQSGLHPSGQPEVPADRADEAFADYARGQARVPRAGRNEVGEVE